MRGFHLVALSFFSKIPLIWWNIEVKKWVHRWTLATIEAALLGQKQVCSELGDILTQFILATVFSFHSQAMRLFHRAALLFFSKISFSTQMGLLLIEYNSSTEKPQNKMSAPLFTVACV